MWSLSTGYMLYVSMLLFCRWWKYSSFWLTSDPCLVVQCAEEQRLVPESLYPFNYNPKMSLNLSQVPCSSQKSPNRTQRRETTGEKDKMVGPEVTKPPPLTHTHTHSLVCFQVLAE